MKTFFRMVLYAGSILCFSGCSGPASPTLTIDQFESIADALGYRVVETNEEEMGLGEFVACRGAVDPMTFTTVGFIECADVDKANEIYDAIVERFFAETDPQHIPERKRKGARTSQTIWKEPYYLALTRVKNTVLFSQGTDVNYEKAKNLMSNTGYGVSLTSHRVSEEKK